MRMPEVVSAQLQKRKLQAILKPADGAEQLREKKDREAQARMERERGLPRQSSVVGQAPEVARDVESISQKTADEIHKCIRENKRYRGEWWAVKTVTGVDGQEYEIFEAKDE